MENKVMEAIGRKIVMKDRYKIIKCYIVWNEEMDCQASVPLYSERSAQEFIDDLNNRDQIGEAKK